jgi:Zn finger protein HypA/HybF involved in hydrogenase expression
MKTKCDRCGVSNLQERVFTVPIQFPDETVSYIQLCPGCMSYALKLTLEELLQVEEILSEQVDEIVSRRDVFNNILNNIKSR